MTVVGVIDLMNGLAVHARGGRRDQYQPVSDTARGPIDAGDATALARFYVDDCHLRHLYLADLDALAGLPAQQSTIEALTALGASVWVDAGIRGVTQARRWWSLGVTRVIVGLETLESFDALRIICDEAGSDRVAFSLDLRAGQPMTTGQGLTAEDAPSLARLAVGAGVETMIVLDVARVGMSEGPDIGVMTRVRAAAPGVALFAGGGIRDESDLANLAHAGCDGALVATALLNGRLIPRASGAPLNVAPDREAT